MVERERGSSRHQCPLFRDTVQHAEQAKGFPEGSFRVMRRWMETLLLTQGDLRRILSLEDAIRAVERAFAAHGRGEVVMPAKVYLELSHHEGDFRAMPAYLDGAAGVKWVNSHPHNPATHRLPTVMGLFVLSDPATALPLAVMDASLLTAVRTGAASVVATKHLARRGARSLGVIGCGVQARWALLAHRVLFGEAMDVLAADISRQAAERFAAEHGGRAVSLQEAAAADVIVVATPSRSPVVRDAWVRDGAHVNALGADAPGKQEIDPALLRRARLYVDDRHQAFESGEVNVPLRTGALQEGQVLGTLGAVVAGRAEGRRSEGEVTLFDSTGLAVQDVAVARAFYDAARDAGVGSRIDFFR